MQTEMVKDQAEWEKTAENNMQKTVEVRFRRPFVYWSGEPGLGLWDSNTNIFRFIGGSGTLEHVIIILKRLNILFS